MRNLEVSSDNYFIRPGDLGNEMVLTGVWSDRLLEIIDDQHVTSMWVNYASGFVGDDISFLTRIPRLKKLMLIHYGISDLSCLNHLHDLTSLSIGNRRFSGLTFSSFPRLEFCSFAWQRSLKDFFECKTLTKVSIGKYPGPNLAAFASFPKLTNLHLRSSPISTLNGLELIPSLRVLGLYYLSKLSDLSAIKANKLIEVLDMEHCSALGDLSPLSELSSLRRLVLSDCGQIPSVEAVSKISSLVNLIFTGTNVLDGNLVPLERLENLKFTVFDNKKHYNRKNSEFPQIVEARIAAD